MKTHHGIYYRRHPDGHVQTYRERLEATVSFELSRRYLNVSLSVHVLNIKTGKMPKSSELDTS